MTVRTSLVLVRHGRTVWHAENRYAGTSDIDLDEVGRRQSAELAQWAATAPLTAVVCSPLRRARETAEPGAAAAGVPLVVDDDLRELGFGLAEGRTLDELAVSDPAMVHRFRGDPVRHHFPGGEPPSEAAQRGAAALHRWAEEQAGGTVLVVAHSTLLRLALCELLGVDVRRYREAFPRLDNGALTAVTLPAGSPGRAGLLSFNVPLPPVRPAPDPLHDGALLAAGEP